ncbi:hypothetical protein HanRHA438_Chr09g0406311 [Helianthus annuus]|nr:hypothetical protein HanHA300_Chr09g0323691 [Helianthus annuus]KAJ0534922.1 hypothetical protein HanIR_Chr09g0425131 [Helianthus annuus]KAJ0888823.1 hypothetical protein HanRHA438_Chr09g0406311 [Helianthus annuus]
MSLSHSSISLGRKKAGSFSTMSCGGGSTATGTPCSTSRGGSGGVTCHSAGIMTSGTTFHPPCARRSKNIQPLVQKVDFLKATL